VALQTAHTTIFPYTIDGVPFWMRYYMTNMVNAVFNFFES